MGEMMGFFGPHSRREGRLRPGVPVLDFLPAWTHAFLCGQSVLAVGQGPTYSELLI